MGQNANGRAVTVYFDTNFWVKLASLDADEGHGIVESLGTMAVRPVISELVLHELLRKATKLDVDRRIVELAGAFPGCLDLTGRIGGFRVLLAPPAMRTPLAEFQNRLHEQTAVADSLSLTGERGDAPAEGIDITEHWPKMQRLFLPFGVHIPSFDEFEQMDQGAKQHLWKRMEQVLPPAVREQLDLTSRLKQSVTGGDDRVVQVATNSATQKTRRRLSADLRDASHMAVFVQHRTRIDFLQVDARQGNRVERQKDHELHALGLAERCFVAREPADTLPTLRLLISARFPGSSAPMRDDSNSPIEAKNIDT